MQASQASEAGDQELFLAIMMDALAPGGRCAVVVPEGLLFGSTEAHVDLRKKIVNDFHLHAVDANATVTATAEPGFTFLNWSDNGVVVSANSFYTLAMDVNHSLVANFALSHSISTSAVPLAGGTTTGDVMVNDGGSVTVTATANGGYTFTDSKYKFTIMGSRTLVANFIVIPATGFHETENENEMEFEWPETADGWVLQECTDLSHWVNSTRPITLSGGKKHTRVSTLNIPGVFFRLVKP